jgi:prepilin-type N-terminal cleavage/methylation domain-containing protein
MITASYMFQINRRQSGFTLIEMGMVLMIVALLLGGLLPTLSSQVDQRHENDTRKQLDEIQQALIGYAIINGRLPCPATLNPTSSHGIESPSGGGTCTKAHTNDTYVPAVTLGLSGTDSNGLIEDAWGNPIRFAVTTGGSSTFTTANGMSTTGISSLGTTANLIVCDAASSSSSSCSVSNSTLTSNAVAIIYSTGKNGANGGTGADEAENPNTNSSDTDRVYVSHTPSATFDDMVIWLSPNILVNRMVSAGKLP